MGVADLTLADMVRAGARSFGDRPWLVTDEARISHRDCAARAEQAARRLAAAGIGHGDRIAILAHNRPKHLDLLFGAARLGAVLVSVNWRLQADEVAYVLKDAAPRIVVTEPLYAELMGSFRPDLTEVEGWWALDGVMGGFVGYDDLPEADLPETLEVGADDGVLIIHTAAVGGRPRGAVLTHRNLLAANEVLGRAWSLGPRDVGLGALPLFHISGLGQALAVQQYGGATLLPHRFDAADAAAAIAREGVTVFCEFAPMLGQILDAAEAGGHDLSSLRCVWGLDAAATIARLEAACPQARFFVGYGQSETSGLVSLAPSKERPGSAGLPVPLAAVEILDEDDRPAPSGQVGEIGVRGPLVFKGYWNLPDDTAHTFRSGWHHTGDMGRFDEAGSLVYAGRSPAKELIKSGGENIYPAEVEAAIRAHPAVAEAVVIGVPDPQWHETVKAICVLAPDATLDAATLITFVADRVARYKRPRHVVFVDALPRTEAGLVDRQRIKSEHGGG